jgi:hypothetical protein
MLPEGLPGHRAVRDQALELSSPELTAVLARLAGIRQMLMLSTIDRHRGQYCREWIISVATAMQESGLRNLAGEDRDSVGLFQQRPSRGWGTPPSCGTRSTLPPSNGNFVVKTSAVQVEGVRGRPEQGRVRARTQVRSVASAAARWR